LLFTGGSVESAAMIRAILPLLLFAAAFQGMAGTLVRFGTALGDVVVELYDREKPITTSNFLAYVRAGRYTNMFAHRVVPNFVLQGGGFRVVSRGTTNNLVEDVPAFPVIRNEYDIGPRYHNLYGTLSMAKIGPSTNILGTVRFTNSPSAFTRFAGVQTNVVVYTNRFPDESFTNVVTERIISTNGTGAETLWIVSQGTIRYGGGPDSASSQWFLSFGDNSANLDNQNGGFTVFGRVISNTNVFNRLNTFVPFARATNVVYPAGGTFNELPQLTYPVGQPRPTTAQLFAALLYVDVTELPPVALPLPDPATPGVTLAGTSGFTNIIEAAPAPGGPWQALTNFVGTGQPVTVPDPAGTGTNRFYRLSLPASLPRPL
jgi:cyclophilin family peptidyl-prolyl cis-trans isomerase